MEIWQHMPPEAIALEVGSRYGTVTCAISKRQQDSGERVSVEPDLKAINGLLRLNVAANECAGMQVHGVVSDTPASLPSSGYNMQAVKARGGTIPALKIEDLKAQLAARQQRPVRDFTVLVIDCEGCAFDFIREHAEFMRNPALQQVFLEADGTPPASFKGPSGNMFATHWRALWAQYRAEFLPLMCEYGFDVLSIDPDRTCCAGLMHVVFQRGGRCPLPSPAVDFWGWNDADVYPISPGKGYPKPARLPRTGREHLLAQAGIGARAGPQQAAPVEARPVEAAPVEARPVEARPVEARPVEATPVEAARATSVEAADLPASLLRTVRATLPTLSAEQLAAVKKESTALQLELLG